MITQKKVIKLKLPLRKMGTNMMAESEIKFLKASNSAVGRPFQPKRAMPRSEYGAPSKFISLMP